ncbi:DinB family protein [Streptomyces sp. H27-G5]|uniref:DinB family protein n=1 Tax=Streptomyces sp. H27-G5 TaxID=2996698 RepID=UPI00226F2552|nr:DinB family protein [Streptomyces sp. H27-G5]MCY0920772.1 DinB family protein [Streptomyces sp. H27-G5]
MKDEQRTPPVLTGDERATLTSVLQGQRDTLMMKCTGLTDEQLRRKAVAPSELSLLGLVRHLAEVERSWFRNVINAEGVSNFFPRNEAGERTDFHVEDADPAESLRIWEESCERSRAIVAAAESLDVRGHHEDQAYSLHYVMAHMIEEYARHNGHADLLREVIDGVTGE